MKCCKEPVNEHRTLFDKLNWRRVKDRAKDLRAPLRTRWMKDGV